LSYTPYFIWTLFGQFPTWKHAGYAFFVVLSTQGIDTCDNKVNTLPKSRHPLSLFGCVRRDGGEEEKSLYELRPVQY